MSACTCPTARRLIFMDQPPAAESPPCAAGATPSRARGAGLQRRWPAWPPAGSTPSSPPPAICARAASRRPRSSPPTPPRGLAVLEDLGDGLFARLIEQGARRAPLYDAAIDALVRLHAEPPPAVLRGDGGAGRC